MSNVTRLLKEQTLEGPVANHHGEVVLMHFRIRMSDALSAPHSSADIPGQDRESKQKRKGINT